MFKRMRTACRVLRGRPVTSVDEEVMELLHKLREGKQILRDATLEMQRLVPLLHSYQGYLRLNADKRRLAVFIRDNYPKEVERGHHAGMSVMDVAIHYMITERAHTTGVKPVPPPDPESPAVGGLA